MWKRLKKKLERILYKEIEVEVEEEYNPVRRLKVENDSNINSRVAYRYPRQREFPFPAIPDRQRNNSKRTTFDDIDIPAYKRKRMINETRRAPALEHIEQEKTENKKKPFQPSRVPSPIYGYHKRETRRQVEQVPAFIRKQKEQNNEQISNNTKQQEVCEVPNNVMSEQEVSGAKEDSHTTEQSLTPNTLPRRNKKQYEEKQRQQTKQESRGRQVSTTDLPNKKLEGPYNVIMTPRDKRNLLLQKQEQKSSKTIDNRPLKHQKKDKIGYFPLHLLNDSDVDYEHDQPWIDEQTRLLERTLKHFNVRARVVNVSQGPSVTRFEVKPEMGVKVSKIRNLSDDLKLNMAAKDIRIEAPIPGKNTVGIEVPNVSPRMVNLQEIFTASAFKENHSPLSIALGLNIEGAPIVTDIGKMPHGLIAGATGSGKSVCINAILISLLYKAHYDEVKFLLIDPKMVELAPYNGIPHLISPVITDVKAATAALKWAVNEMEERYERFVKEGVRDIKRYNEKVKSQERLEEKMPYLVIVIDELADLMMVSPQDVEDAICRIAQKARAAGIHLLLATQRPSVDVITGLIKANIPTRIAFSVSSQVDSRTIIDHSGAEKLLGKGDMLFVENGSGKSIRLQGPFVSDDEIERITAHARSLAEPNYMFEQETLIEQFTFEEEEDELLPEVIQFVIEENKASTSLLQRHFRIGYNRAARLIDCLEQRGIISQQNGSKPRDVLLTQSQYEALKEKQEHR
ncbi:S-DNA-T family DNA segregation ATPase FtsK/SpoIIIE [Cerasibacillus quisquiliarum]|uniref:DNA translocase FtsK n=1 Tax=Cerasibacillus quisquiliarum TaxID=227865 RepID=A0A511V099_9BACI|nr:DNA translocase FtsK [Cerasibacillus quisquiliarum]MBB5147341.1 S-DNA-T family DNA segregation ATPase FtsK/SpoIIIE [Cerasibacillus quisquiliarum]GEN32299.1 DNA translocase FtsK [Cerasibacillus quisquiliarum]